ncbi:DUF5655 domain-containing protein [Brevibacterium moorei]|uniref:DUF5655 domain-containing protein n=1 Tax=Brevibacterium moorei TaxID=2968457 RepID=UPI00211CA2D2|nr:DUF5655 domain-containing protein [Brevibacterium sp. 68QC2CO]MCQ9385555.1 DUF5655 domain-containing protein [Brevibacterium sp. 68QC2CO]
MAEGSNKMIGEFGEMPRTQGFAAAIEEYTKSLGGVESELKAQLSFSVKRKFLWLWAYQQTADGTLYLNVTLDRKKDDPHFHDVTQVSKNRWNHHVVVKSEESATSDWLRSLIEDGHEFGAKSS